MTIMNIKEILIEMKNITPIDKFEGNYHFGSVVREIYLERIALKYFHTTEKKKVDAFIKGDKKKLKKINKKTKISLKILMFLGYFVIVGLLINSMQFNNSIKILLGGGLSFFSIFLFSVIFDIFDLIKEKRINSIVKKIDIETTKYIKDNFKDFYRNITLDLLKEIGLISDTTLEKEKKELKEYLIAKLHYYENADDESIKGFIEALECKLFNDNKNYLDDKILKYQESKEENLIINTEEENIKLNLLEKNKIPTI